MSSQLKHLCFFANVSELTNLDLESSVKALVWAPGHAVGTYALTLLPLCRLLSNSTLGRAQPHHYSHVCNNVEVLLRQKQAACRTCSWFPHYTRLFWGIFGCWHLTTLPYHTLTLQRKGRREGIWHTGLNCPPWTSLQLIMTKYDLFVIIWSLIHLFIYRCCGCDWRLLVPDVQSTGHYIRRTISLFAYSLFAVYIKGWSVFAVKVIAIEFWPTQ